MQAFFLKNWYWFAAIAFAGIVCFFVGRKTIDQVAGIKYVKMPTVQGTVPTEELKPVSSTIPDKPDLPMRPDTLFLPMPYPVPGQHIVDTQTYYIAQKVDTGKIINEYITLNKYSTTVFDNDTTGKLVINSDVQYNRLRSIGYSFTPVQKVITKERKRAVTPFITGSYNSFNQAAAGGGIYIKNVGVGVKYAKDFTTGKTGYEGGIYIKF